MIFRNEGNALTASRGGENLRIEPWGQDALRVSAVMNDSDLSFPYALRMKEKKYTAWGSISSRALT